MGTVVKLWECDAATLRQAHVYQPISDIAMLLSTGGKPQEALELMEECISNAIKTTRSQISHTMCCCTIELPYYGTCRGLRK